MKKNKITPTFKNFVLISAPGSGKGTFSQYFVKTHDYVHICPGDIFRNEILLQTELGKAIEPIINKGEYVQEEIVCTLMSDKLLQVIREKKHFILDGFPRSLVSFQFLYDFFNEHNLLRDICFVQLLADDHLCIDRILNRQICTQCYKVYRKPLTHHRSHPEKCDDCGINLTLRACDTKNIIEKRLTYFHENIEPLMKLAEHHYQTKKITTDCTLDLLEEKYEQLFTR